MDDKSTEVKEGAPSGTSNNDARLAVYLEHCNSIEKNIDRRLATNRFNVSIVTALAAVGGLVLSNDSTLTTEFREQLVLAIGIIAFIVSVSWFFQILRFREVSRVKHEVALVLEEELKVRRVEREAAKFQKQSTVVEQTLSELLLPLSILLGLLWVTFM